MKLDCGVLIVLEYFSEMNVTKNNKIYREPVLAKKAHAGTLIKFCN